MNDSERAKRRAAEEALRYLPESGVLGLGTGSTSRHFIDCVGELVKQGRDFRGVPTSEQSRAQAEALGIPLLAPEGPWKIDVYVDGADEVSADLCLIKGGGAAHTREKIVNHASRHRVIIVDESKISVRLGERWPVPVEVIEFGHLSTAQALSGLGRPVLRMKGELPLRTDTGNVIYDLHTGPIADPFGLERELSLIPGVVESGLFCGRADAVIVAGSGSVRVLGVGYGEVGLAAK
jgi:ribose 5-phosphate isomerase A